MQEIGKMLGGWIRSTKQNAPNLFPRNYHGRAEDIVIAIVTIPVIDLAPVTRVVSTNIGDVARNVFLKLFSVHNNPTVVFREV